MAAELLRDAPQSENCVPILCTQLLWKYKWIALDEEIYHCVEALDCDFDLRAGGLREEAEGDLGEAGWAAFDFEVEAERRWLCDETGGAAGSATWKRLPGTTLILAPARWFQRRSSVRETPNRSEMVTRVSPRRAV